MVRQMKYKLAALALILGILPAVSAPPGAPVNVTASVTATTGSFNASLAASSNRLNQICGFVITSGGTTSAAVVNATVAGTVSGTMNFAYVFPSSGQGILGVAFPQCINASAANTAITVTVPGGGTGTTAALSVWGYQL